MSRVALALFDDCEIVSKLAMRKQLEREPHNTTLAE
jgi:hypothetical protein